MVSGNATSQEIATFYTHLVFIYVTETDLLSNIAITRH